MLEIKQLFIEETAHLIGLTDEEMLEVENKRKEDNIIKENIFLGDKKGVRNALLQKKPKKATEIVVTFILEMEHIFTTRSDEVSEMWIYKNGIYVAEGKTYLRELCRGFFDAGFTNFLANQVISKVEVETYIEQKDLFVENDINEIPLLNGIFNLKEKKLTPFNPKKRFFNKLPLIYDETKDCPNIKTHLKSVLRNEDDIKVVQEIFGFLLYRRYFVEKAIFFLGDGRNGKSKTMELMKRFIGADNCCNLPLHRIEKEQFCRSDLFRKYANLCADVPSKPIQDSTGFKELTGGDLITADRKFKGAISFVNYAKLIFSCNDLPPTYDSTQAFFYRIVLLDFPFTFISQQEYDKATNKENLKIADKNIIEKLTTPEEMSGLLNWALEGLDRLLQKGDFSYSKTIEEIQDEWEAKSNSVLAFCKRCIVSEYKTDTYISKKEFRQAYTEWCKRNKRQPLNDKKIAYALTTHYGALDMRKQVDDDIREMVWVGIKFKDTDEKQTILPEKP